MVNLIVVTTFLHTAAMLGHTTPSDYMQAYMEDYGRPNSYMKLPVSLLVQIIFL